MERLLCERPLSSMERQLLDCSLNRLDALPLAVIERSPRTVAPPVVNSERLPSTILRFLRAP